MWGGMHRALSLAPSRARYYDPALGRFVSEDPAKLRRGGNFSAYAFGRPGRRDQRPQEDVQRTDRDLWTCLVVRRGFIWPIWAFCLLLVSCSLRGQVFRQISEKFKLRRRLPLSTSACWDLSQQHNVPDCSVMPSTSPRTFLRKNGQDLRKLIPRRWCGLPAPTQETVPIPRPRDGEPMGTARLRSADTPSVVCGCRSRLEQQHAPEAPAFDPLRSTSPACSGRTAAIV